MKNVLIGVYILVVLLMSAFVRASGVVVQNSSYNPNSNLLKIQGHYSGVCLKHVRPSLKVDQTNNGQENFKLDLLADEVCPTQVGNYNFEMAVDTRTIGLPENQPLVLNFNHPMQKRVSEPLVVYNKFSYNLDFSQLNLITGQVALFQSNNANPQYVLLTQDNKIYALSGPFNFSNYVNQVISVKGYELQTQVQPIREMIAASDLIGFNVMTVFTLN